MVLFSAIFSCFLLDSFEVQEMVCLTKHGATFSSLNISRHTYCSGYDEYPCDAIIFSLIIIIIFSLMLETEESISEIAGHHILQEASEL